MGLAVLVLAVPIGATIPPLAALFGLVIILGGLVVFETVHYAETRRGLRNP